MSQKKYKVGIVPGSFDPITVGHLAIVRRAAELCDEVYVAVMINSQKKYTFTMEQRKRIAEAACADVANAKVITSEGMLYELARALGAEAIIKGVRNETDRAYEEEMAKFNSEHYKEAKTVLLKASDGLSDISSTLVRAKLAADESIEGLLPGAALDEINRILNNK